MYQKFAVKANGIHVDAYTKTASEAAKFLGVYLLHRGKLQSFSVGVEPEVIEVRADDLHVEFLAWFTIRDGKTRVILQSKHVRRVSLLSFTVLMLIRFQNVLPSFVSNANLQIDYKNKTLQHTDMYVYSYYKIVYIIIDCVYYILIVYIILIS